VFTTTARFCIGGFSLFVPLFSPLPSGFSLFSSFFGWIYDQNGENSGTNSEKPVCA